MIGDVLFVVVVFIAVYVRRFGPRGTALGMVTFMSYFFSLYLRAKFAELPWLIGATVVGTLCSYLWSAFIMPDRPESVLRANIRSLRARMAIVVDTTADTVRLGNPDERRRRRLRIRARRLNETALTVQAQIEDRVNPSALWPGVSGEDLALWLFDAELTVERLATAGTRAAQSDLPAATRAELADTVALLARAIRTPHTDALRHDRTASLSSNSTGIPMTCRCDASRWPSVDTAKATAEVRQQIERVSTETTQLESPTLREKPRGPGMLPTTRQAIQVAVAASLAIVVGEIVSPSHWYWAAIAAFVIFAGTNSWAETLDKGWQRLLGTVLGVPSGVLVATLVSGNKIASLAMIFVCLFCAFYFMKVTYSLMTFWISTMLALMYGLLGEFTYGLLLLRIEETAVGAVIGIAAAVLVLPINTRAKIRGDAHTFFLTLADLVEASVASLLGTPAPARLTETARQLGRDLAAVPDHRQADERRGRRIGGAPDHAARHADTHRMRPLCANPGPQQRVPHQHVTGAGRRDQIDRRPDPPQHRHADHRAGVQPGLRRSFRPPTTSTPRRPSPARTSPATGARSPAADERPACAAPTRPGHHQRRHRPRRRERRAVISAGPRRREVIPGRSVQNHDEFSSRLATFGYAVGFSDLVE